MTATELYLKDGRSAEIFFCGACKIVHRTQAEAEACCVPKLCACGAVLDKYWTACQKCRDAKDHQQEKERYAAAEKIKAADWPGPVWCDINYNEGFFATFEDLVEHCEDEGASIPHVYACDSVPICVLDYDSIIEQATEEAYDGWETDRLEGEEELKAAIESFNAKNKNQTNWIPNYKLAVTL